MNNELSVFTSQHKIGYAINGASLIDASINFL